VIFVMAGGAALIALLIAEFLKARPAARLAARRGG